MCHIFYTGVFFFGKKIFIISKQKYRQKKYKQLLYISSKQSTLNNVAQCNVVQCHAMPCNAVQCRAMPCNAVQCRTMQCNTVH